MFISKYNKVFSQYYELRSAVLSDSARKHELCYLKRFDKYIADSIQSDEDVLLESFMCKWISSLYLGHDSLNETEKYLKFSSEMYPETTKLFGSFMKDLLPEVDHET